MRNNISLGVADGGRGRPGATKAARGELASPRMVAAEERIKTQKEEKDASV